MMYHEASRGTERRNEKQTMTKHNSTVAKADIQPASVAQFDARPTGD